jgi:hypothetical protein
VCTVGLCKRRLGFETWSRSLSPPRRPEARLTQPRVDEQCPAWKDGRARPYTPSPEPHGRARPVLLGQTGGNSAPAQPR